ncbi:hypothetical protein MLD38_018927 [Melastoma candidum]|uniref:Uncharacterized protein n=1 Tax=Melastoma candidum TaxID=119954 RepID=A0ACB9QUR4_9MYRT|nr:hypothetical protein MLD38_018927 [Melastoma candidum]
MAYPSPSLAAGASRTPPPPVCFDRRWRLPKKEIPSSSRPKSTRKCSFTGRCARLVREQRARFYITRRCIAMLVCWHDYGDS